MLTQKKLSVQLVKSLIGRKPKHLSSIKVLGLRRINQKVTILDNIYNRGLIRKISYLLKIENI